MDGRAYRDFDRIATALEDIEEHLESLVRLLEENRDKEGEAPGPEEGK